MTRAARLLLWFVLGGLAGCAPALPRYEPMPADRAVAIIRERALAIHTVAAQGRVMLTDAEGRRVSFDAALVARGDGKLRLRAWKFNQAVFDLTHNEQGLWLWQSRRMQNAGGQDRGESAEGLPGGLSAKRLRTAWELASGQWPEGAALDIVDHDPLVISYPYAGEPDDPPMTLRITVDRQTLVPLRSELLDAQGQARLTVRSQRYRMIDDHPWPMRLTAESRWGEVRLVWSEVQLNASVVPGAFVPPARATKRAEP